jgi:hypothetical protein
MKDGVEVIAGGGGGGGCKIGKLESKAGFFAGGS